MKNKMTITNLVAFLLLASFGYSSTSLEFDYCVADPTLPHGPSGYSCKDPKTLTADDFSYSGLSARSNTSNIFKFGATPAWINQFPALNGLGLSIVRADIEVGGVGPIHSHRVAELVLAVEGKFIAGFIDTNNKAIYKTLEAGDLFVVPPALEHFQVNVGDVPVVAYAAFSSPNPGFFPATNSLFQGDLPTDTIQKVTLLDVEQIQKLKKVFGGTN